VLAGESQRPYRDVVLVGNTVRKSPPQDPAFIRRLLGHFAQHRWGGAPRFLGVDDKGRDMLSYLAGEVPWQQDDQPLSIRSERSLTAVAQLVRQFHDLTADTALADGEEVVCHNDLSPKNTVYRDLGSGLQPVAFIDWDIAAPGKRVHDVAHVCWQYIDLGPQVRDTATAARLVRVIADAYGLTDRSALIDTILWWQDRCWRGILAAADAGDPAMARLRELGTVKSVRAAYAGPTTTATLCTARLFWRDCQSGAGLAWPCLHTSCARAPFSRTQSGRAICQAVPFGGSPGPAGSLLIGSVRTGDHDLAGP
jgi:hypothetical protein